MIALDRLSTIIPPNLALANKALAVSMAGITGIRTMTLPQLASTVGNVQTNYGLNLINSANSAVAPGAVTAIIAAVGTGTGPKGTITVEDGLGTAAGCVSTNAMINTVSIINSVNVTGLISGYNNMYGTIQGNYTVHVEVEPPTDPPTYLGYQVIVPGGLGAGTYPSSGYSPTAAAAVNSAFTTGLIPAVTAAIPTTGTATQRANLNANWSNMINQLNLEKSVQTRAGLNFANLVPNNTSSIYSLVFQLPQLGQDTSQGGSAQFIQALANLNNIGGQATVGSMRQGQSRVNGTGVGTNSQVPVLPATPPPQAVLTPAQYPYPQPVVV